MKSIKIFQVDAFSEKLFSGNPAAVCVLEKPLSEKLMQQIASENNLAETAFVLNNNKEFEIRWFTPTVEVDLCGHATLASAFVLFNFYDYKDDEIIFNTLKSGLLKVRKDKDILILDFPADEIKQEETLLEVIEGIGVIPKEFYKGKTDYMAVLNSEDELIKINPNFNAILKLKARGLIVTAPGSKTDFVSRFFAPQTGINEDPVTGSSHTTLIPYWSKRLNKKELTAKQLSSRSGLLYCRDKESRVEIGGKAVLYLKGEIFLEET